MMALGEMYIVCKDGLPGSMWFAGNMVQTSIPFLIST